MAASVSIDIIANDRGASGNLRDVGSAAEDSGGKFRKMGALAKAGGIAVAAGVGLAAGAAVKLAAAAMDDAKAAEQLAVSLRNNANASKSTIAATEDWITAQGLAKGVADDDLRPALAQLVTATHDVGKAQRLTSLAMDISAGRNVKLATVTKALEKAQNGTVTGLGKFGVKVKDAAGEARSLHDIMRDLSKSVEGQAGRAANTTAGKFDRLKLQFSETGEAIGYKLLPYAEDFADLVFTRVIPGADSLKRAFERNGIDGLVSKLEKLTGTQGKLKPIFDQVRNSGEALWDIVKELAPAFLDAVDGAEGLLSPLKLLDDVLGVVADVLKAIPDNILTLGIQAGAAALILPRLTAAVTGASGAMVVATRNTIGFTRALATGNMAGAATGIAKLGGVAKNVAGVGGILALSSGLGELKEKGTTATGVMKTMAGGAGIGAMFGPIGTLVGAGAGGVLGLVVGGFKKTAEEAEKARLELMKSEGFKNAKEDANTLRTALVGVADAYGNTTRAAIEASFTGEDGKLDSDIAKLRDLGVSMETIVSASLGQADAQRIVTGALGGSLDDLSIRVDMARAKYDELADGITTTYNAAGTPINVSVPKEQIDAAKAALMDAESAFAEASTASEVFAARIDETSGAITDNRKKLKGLASDLGISVKHYKDFPKAVRTEFEANGLRQTSAGAMRLISQYKGLRNYKSIKAVISAPGVDLTAKQIGKLAREYKLTPKQVRSLIKLEGVSATVRDLGKVGKGFKVVETTKYTGADFARTLRTHMGGFAQDAEQGGRKVAGKLKDGTKGAKPNLDDYKRALAAGVNSGQITARQGAIGIGAALKSGLPSGFAGASGLWSSQVAAAVHAAIAAGRRAADAHSPSRKTGLLGKDLALGLVVGMKGQSGNLGAAGADLIESLVRGLDKGQVKAAKVLSAIDRRVEQTVDRVKSLLSQRSETVSAFQGFATSVFATSGEDGAPMTVDSLLAAQSAQRDQASDVKGAVKRLLAMGMSKSLIAQMQAAGPSGIQQLLTLSTANASQIGLLNNLNKQTEADYASTGMSVFGATGGAAELAQARRDEALAKKIAKELDDLVGNHMANYTFTLHGDTLVATLNRHDRDRGKDRHKDKAGK